MAQGPWAGYEHALVIDDGSSEQCLARARELLERREGIVILDGVLALRPGPDGIRSEVIDPESESHRCAEEFKVLVENAGRRLAASKLATRLPRGPMRWLVVDGREPGIVELWAARPDSRAADHERAKSNSE